MQCQSNILPKISGLLPSFGSVVLPKCGAYIPTSVRPTFYYPKACNILIAPGPNHHISVIPDYKTENVHALSLLTSNSYLSRTLKIKSGFTQGTPSTEIVKCVFQCHFSKSDLPPLTTDSSGSAYISPSPKKKGNRGWFMLVMTCNLLP